MPSIREKIQSFERNISYVSGGSGSNPSKVVFGFAAFLLLGVGGSLIISKAIQQSQAPERSLAQAVPTKALRVIDIRYIVTSSDLGVPPVNLSADMEAMMEFASRYHGRKFGVNNNSEPVLDVQIVETINKTTSPNRAETEYPAFYNALQAIIQENDLCNKVNNQQVDQVWLTFSRDHGGTYNQEFYMDENYNDRPNYRSDWELPKLCPGRTVSYVTLNPYMIPPMMDGYGHFAEGMISMTQGHEFFWGRFTGKDYWNIYPAAFPVNQTCGNDHYPPNGSGTDPMAGYDYINKNSVSSFCGDWKPDGSGTRENINCDIWQCDVNNQYSSARNYFIWWFQQMPGRDTTITWLGRRLPPWHEFFADTDNTIRQYVNNDGYYMNPYLYNLDNISTTKGTGTNTATWQHKSSGGNRLLLIAASYRPSVPEGKISAATVDGLPLTFLRRDKYADQATELWYVKQPPENPAGNINVNFDSAMNEYVISAMTFADIDQTNPFRDAAGVGAGSTTLNAGVAGSYSLPISSNIDDIVVGVINNYADQNTIQPTSQHRVLGYESTTNIKHDVGLRIGAAAQTIQWVSNRTNPWSASGVSLRRSATQAILPPAGTTASTTASSGTTTTFNAGTAMDLNQNTAVLSHSTEEGEVLATSSSANIILLTAAYRASVNSTAQITSATYCGRAMTRVGTRAKSQDQTSEMWYLLNPPTGTCAVTTVFDKDPEERIISTTLFNNIDVNAPVESSHTGVIAYPPGATLFQMSKAGPKNSMYVCTYSNYPAGSFNPIAAQATDWRQLWTKAGGVVQTGLAASNTRVSDNQTVTMKWTTPQSFPWAGVCANFRVKQFVNTPSLKDTPTNLPPPPPAPTVDLKVNSSNGPINVSRGSSVTVSWTSLNAQWCTATTSSALPAWTGVKAATGSETFTNLQSTAAIGLSCSNSGGSGIDSVLISVSTSTTPLPTFTPPPASPIPSPTLTTRGTPPPPMKGWTASYYPNTTFSEGGSNSLSNLIGTVGSVNFDWGTGNPVGKYGFNFSLTFPSDNFSANFYGTVTPTVSGTYGFKTDQYNTPVFTITNGSGVQTTVINGGGIRSANYAMTAGQTYTLNVRYIENTGNAKMKLFWKTPGTTAFVSIPAESMGPVDTSWLLLLSSGTSSVVGLPPQNSCEHTVRFVNKPNDGTQNVMDVDAVVENYVVIEEDSPRLKRDTTATWTQTCGGAASGDCLYYTRTNGGGMEFKTKAQKITYLGRKGDKQGSMQMYIDGVLKFTQNRYAASYIGQQPIDISLTNLTCPSGATSTPTPVLPPPPPASAPVVNLTANGSGGPITIAANSSVTLTWSTSNATSCSAAANVATTNWSGAKSISGAQAVTIGTSRTLSLTCSGTGGTTTDSVVVNVSSTATPTPPPITSQSVYLSFDGVDDSATVLNSTSLNLPSSDVSMSLWVNRGSGGGAVQSLMGKAFGTAASYGIDLDNGIPRVGVRSDSGLATLSDAAVVVPSGVWTHVAASIDDTGSGVVVNLYINGTLRWTKTSTIRVGTSSSNLIIGQRPGGGNYFKGFLDDIRVYQRVLSASEMSTLNAKGNPSTTNLKAQFRFNEASGQTLIDSSINGNTGFLGITSSVEASDPLRSSGGIN